MNTVLLGLGQGQFFFLFSSDFQQKELSFCVSGSPPCLSLSRFSHNNFLALQLLQLLLLFVTNSRTSCFITSFNEDLVGQVERYSCKDRVNPSRSSVAYCLIYAGKRRNFLA